MQEEVFAKEFKGWVRLKYQGGGEESCLEHVCEEDERRTLRTQQEMLQTCREITANGECAFHSGKCIYVSSAKTDENKSSKII